MHSDQEKAIFSQYGWEFDYIGRIWIAPDGTKLTQDALVELTVDADGDLALMRFIVERGQRTV